MPSKQVLCWHPRRLVGPRNFPTLWGREKPWGLEDMLTFVPAGFTLCTSPTRHIADSETLETPPALQKSQKTKFTFSQVQLARGGGGGTFTCLAFLGLVVFLTKILNTLLQAQ